MVQTGTPEQYFGSIQQIAMPQPIQATVEARMVEPVDVRYAQSQLQTPDYTPLIICVSFLGTLCFLAFLAWSWKK